MIQPPAAYCAKCFGKSIKDSKVNCAHCAATCHPLHAISTSMHHTLLPPQKEIKLLKEEHWTPKLVFPSQVWHTEIEAVSRSGSTGRWLDRHSMRDWSWFYVTTKWKWDKTERACQTLALQTWKGSFLFIVLTIPPPKFQITQATLVEGRLTSQAL